MGRSRILRGMPAIVLFAGAMVVVSPAPTQAADAMLVSPTAAEQIASAFDGYGDTSGRWAGADGTTSVALPDGRFVWLFSDTMMGAVNPDHSLASTARLVNNSAVVQDGAQLVTTLTGGTTEAPESLVPTGVDNEWYWVGDATVAGGDLKVIYNRYRRTGTGALDFTLLGSALATFSLPALSLTGVVELPLGDRVAWGSAILDDGGYSYIYGSEGTSDGLKFAHLARVPVGALGGTWEFWTGTGWSSSLASSARLLSGVHTNFGVQKVGAQYVLVTIESNLVFNPSVVAYTAPAPTGPFAGPIQLFTAPEPLSSEGKPIIAYGARLHPELAPAGKLLVSYDVNSLDIADVYADIRTYRPRFVELDWPRPTPDPASLPDAPTGLTATADDEGHIDVTWQAPAGSGLSYWIYRRDVTAGQTHFAREVLSTQQTSARLDLLRNDHAYEVKVTAAYAAGEGPASDVASATARMRPPAAPTGVTASVDIAGKATISWAAVANVWGYEVSMRNVTAGETTFVKVKSADSDATSAVIEWLDNGSTYEFSVTATNGAGSSPPSTVASVTAHHAVPPAPTQLSATPNPDGTIALAWTVPGPDVWYLVYQRDVTAGEPDFTQLPLPVTECCAMTAGYLLHDHVYEFTVSATNRIGEGTRSALASATARYSLPGAASELTATANADGTIDLSWTAPGSDLWYHVYQRDITAGEAQFTALPLPVSACCAMTADHLSHGHAYEFKVTATNQAGEGSASNLVRATATLPPPGPPSNLTATEDDGQIVLTWTASSTAGAWYWIYVRDVTAGEAQFTKLEWPLTTCCTFTSTYLTHGHTYEYKVAAIGTSGGPDSASSNVASATAIYPPPGAPTNLTATPGNGQVTLNWTASSDTDAWSWIYVRDVTAGEAQFTRLEWPLSTCCTFTSTWLTNGHTYEYKVAAIGTAGGPDSPPSNIASAVPAALPPSSLVATPGNGEVTLTWTASPTPSWYWIYVRDVTAGETGFTRLEWPLSTCCTFTSTYLTNGHTYQYKVAAIGFNGGLDSAPSNVASATPAAPPPGAPSNLTATPGNGQVTLNWTASSTPGAWYWIYVRDVTAGETQFTRLEWPLTTCCTFTSTWLVNGHRYEYKVAAIGSGGAPDSPPSNVASAVPAALPPSNLAATPGNGQVTLTWTESPTPSWYWVYQRDVTAGESWQRLQLPISTCCTFSPGYLVNGHTYQFKLTSAGFNGGLDSGPSNVVSVTPVGPPPGPPTNLTASAGNGKVTLTWTASSTPGAWYWVYQRDATDGQSWQKLPLPLTTCCSFVAQYLVNGHSYQFKVAAIGSGGPDSPPSNVVAATPTAPPPGPPTNLSATPGNGKVTLTWTASSTPGAWYWVYQRDATTGQSWQKLPLPLTTCCTFVAQYLVNGHSYQFKVAAIGSGGPDSPPSNVVTATPVTPTPGAPSNLTATPGDARVVLHWTASSTPGAWYWIYQRDVSTGQSWQKLPLPFTGCCTFTARFLVNGHTYEFKVAAVGGGGAPDSPASNVASARPTVPLTVKPHLYGASTGMNSSSLWWTAVPYATGYWIEQIDLSRGGQSWTRLPYPVLSTSFDPGLLFQGTWYRWRVIPMNGALTGPASDPIEIRTRGDNMYAAHFALGDSYSAGIGAGQEGSSPCFRSPRAWPLWLSVWRNNTYHLACNGQEIPGLRSSQLTSMSVPASPTLITLTIGGNDVGFAPELEHCVRDGVWVQPNPFFPPIYVPTSCTYREPVLNARIDALRSTLVGLYRDIRRDEGPGADIIIGGYPLLIAAPGAGKCDPTIAWGLSADERTMIRRLSYRLNSVIEQAAFDAGVIEAAAETIGQFAGHEACMGDEYINQLTYSNHTQFMSSFHPNGAGQQAFTRAINIRMDELERYGAVRR